MNTPPDFFGNNDPVRDSRANRIRALLQKISVCEQDPTGLLRWAVAEYWRKIWKCILFKG
jgi:hypothetical protein